MVDIVAGLMAAVNAGWGWRLESKQAVMQKEQDGYKELQDERYETLTKRLDTHDAKLDRILDRLK